MGASQDHSANIKVTYGGLQIEYSGDQRFIEGGGLLSFIESLVGESAKIPLLPPEKQSEAASSSADQERKSSQLSTNTIAGLMASQSGPDLIVAAVAHIQLVQGKSTATRSEIAEEMKSATAYYKRTFSSNLSAYLNNLVRNRRLNQVSTSTYALPKQERENMEALIEDAG